MPNNLITQNDAGKTEGTPWRKWDRAKPLVDIEKMIIAGEWDSYLKEPRDKKWRLHKHWDSVDSRVKFDRLKQGYLNPDSKFSAETVLEYTQIWFERYRMSFFLATYQNLTLTFEYDQQKWVMHKGKIDQGELTEFTVYSWADNPQSSPRRGLETDGKLTIQKTIRGEYRAWLTLKKNFTASALPAMVQFAPQPLTRRPVNLPSAETGANWSVLFDNETYLSHYILYTPHDNWSNLEEISGVYSSFSRTNGGSPIAGKLVLRARRPDTVLKTDPKSDDTVLKTSVSQQDILFRSWLADSLIHAGTSPKPLEHLPIGNYRVWFIRPTVNTLVEAHLQVFTGGRTEFYFNTVSTNQRTQRDGYCIPIEDSPRKYQIRMDFGTGSRRYHSYMTLDGQEGPTGSYFPGVFSGLFGSTHKGNEIFAVKVLLEKVKPEDGEILPKNTPIQSPRELMLALQGVEAPIREFFTDAQLLTDGKFTIRTDNRSIDERLSKLGGCYWVYVPSTDQNKVTALPLHVSLTGDVTMKRGMENELYEGIAWKADHDRALISVSNKANSSFVFWLDTETTDSRRFLHGLSLAVNQNKPEQLVGRFAVAVKVNDTDVSTEKPNADLAALQRRYFQQQMRVTEYMAGSDEFNKMDNKNLNRLSFLLGEYGRIVRSSRSNDKDKVRSQEYANVHFLAALTLLRLWGKAKRENDNDSLQTLTRTILQMLYAAYLHGFRQLDLFRWLGGQAPGDSPVPVDNFELVKLLNLHDNRITAPPFHATDQDLTTEKTLQDLITLFNKRFSTPRTLKDDHDWKWLPVPSQPIKEWINGTK